MTEKKSKTPELIGISQSAKHSYNVSQRSPSVQKVPLFKRTAPITSENYWPNGIQSAHKRQISDISNLKKQ